MHNLTSFNDRFGTFRSFPVAAAVKPHDLAEAGFYYTGEGDTVRCVYNGCEVCQWEDGDQPMLEHALHYPHCSFVQTRAQSNDVSDACGVGIQRNWPTVIERSPVEEPMFLSLQETDVKPREAEYGPPSVGALNSSISSIGERENNPAEEVQAYMDTEIIQMLVKKKYKVDLLKTVCETFVAENRCLPKADKLVEAYWVLEESGGVPADIEPKLTSPPTTQTNSETTTVKEQQTAAEGSNTCVICTSPLGTTQFIPCGHVVCCDECADDMDVCAGCSAKVVATKKV